MMGTGCKRHYMAIVDIFQSEWVVLDLNQRLPD